MTDGVYSNGLPHPTKQVRTRIVMELAATAVLTFLFLGFAPAAWKNLGTFVGLALVALGVILYDRKETEEKIWGPPESPDFDRVRRCGVNMVLLTVPSVIVCLCLGLAARNWLPQLLLSKEPCPMFSLHFLMALGFYLPWAMLQQTLFQFYLLGRLRALFPFASPLTLSVFNGIAYGMVHLTSPSGGLLAVVTILGGIFWSYSYYRDRYVIPIAISHALLGSTFYYWVIGRDIMGELLK